MLITLFELTISEELYGSVQVAELCGLGIVCNYCTANLVQQRETVCDLSIGEEF